MTMKEIPDIKYKLVDDGSLINIEQGHLDPVYVSLHKIHIKHIAEIMKIGVKENEISPMLVDYLEQINEQATQLFEFLDAIPNSSPLENEPPCLVMSRKLMIVANQALSFWGNH